GTIYLLGGGMAMSLLTLFMIISQSLDQHYLLWISYGVFSSFGTLLYTQTASGFPVSLSGRANTTLNLLVFLGAFSLQWGMGIMIDQLIAGGFSP
ncbi:MFS transporter, partial [bacterium]|nr:MFS transporter [bacterium]